MPWSTRKAEELGFIQDHGLTVVAAMDRGEPITASLFFLLRCAIEDALFAAYKGVF